MASVSTSAADDPGVIVLTEWTIANRDIDNRIFNYFVRAAWTTPSATQDINVRSVVIDYTVDTLTP